MADPLPGRYRHYKGNEYTVLGIARHSETLEDLVVYRPEYGDRGLWVRPRSMFVETVESGDRRVPRFEAIPQPQISSSGQNVFADLPAALPEEVIQAIVSAPQLRIERILSFGQKSPPDFWYDQADHEWVLVLKGSAIVEFEDRQVEMRSGDYLFIPAHVRHRVAWTTTEETTVWLAVHFGTEA